MIIPTTKDDLVRLIQDRVEESHQLEYKAAQALANRDVLKDVAKDVSAMANASGGVIIYGIKEHNNAQDKHRPESITPIERKSFSKERLEQIINGNISPKIDGLIIHPITLDSSAEVAYVVEIPQGQTAHQNTKDFIYYKRHNFEAVPMLDYEIRDVMNRLKHPTIEMQFEIEMSYNPTTLPDTTTYQTKRYTINFTLKFWLLNTGNQFAKYVNYFVELPSAIVDNKLAKSLPQISPKILEYAGDNTVRDVIDESLSPTASVISKYGPSRFVPLLPGLKSIPRTILLDSDLNIDDSEIKWRVFADNARENSGAVTVNTIKVTKKYN